MKKTFTIYTDSSHDYLFNRNSFYYGWFCGRRVRESFNIPLEVKELELVLSDKPQCSDSYLLKLDKDSDNLHFLDTEEPHKEMIQPSASTVLRPYFNKAKNNTLYVTVYWEE